MAAAPLTARFGVRWQAQRDTAFLRHGKVKCHAAASARAPLNPGGARLSPSRAEFSGSNPSPNPPAKSSGGRSSTTLRWTVTTESTPAEIPARARGTRPYPESPFALLCRDDNFNRHCHRGDNMKIRVTTSVSFVENWKVNGQVEWHWTTKRALRAEQARRRSQGGDAGDHPGWTFRVGRCRVERRSARVDGIP
jgi:hypothetical protein